MRTMKMFTACILQYIKALLRCESYYTTNIVQYTFFYWIEMVIIISSLVLQFLNIWLTYTSEKLHRQQLIIFQLFRIYIYYFDWIS